MRARGRLRNLLHGGLLLLVVVLAVELGSLLLFRIAEGRWLSREQNAEERAPLLHGDLTDMPQTDRKSPYAVHPYLGFVYNPEINGPGLTELHGHPISDFGLIDSDGPIRKRAPDKVILGIFGGSVAYYFSAQGLDALLARLADAPPFRGKRIEVVRVALGGWRQPQQLMALNYILALGGELDLLVNIDGFNEVTQYATAPVATRPYLAYPSSWPRLVAGAPMHRALEGELALLRESRRRIARALEAGPWRFSATATLAWKRSDRLLAGMIASDESELGRRTSSDARPYAVTGPLERPHSDADLYRQLVLLWSRSSIQMDRLCRANGIRYHHVLQPNQYDPDSKTLNPEELSQAYNPHHPYKYAVRAGYKGLRAEGRQLVALGVPFVDLSGLFAGNDETLYRDPCCHLTKRGNEILAAAVADAILAEPR